MRNWVFIVLLLIVMLSACKQKEDSADRSVSSPSPSQTVAPTSTPLPTVEPLPVVERFTMPSHGERLKFDHHLSGTSGWTIFRTQSSDDKPRLELSFTRNQGTEWVTTLLPSTHAWELETNSSHIFTSFNITGPSWIMLTSLDMADKTLYRSDDDGKSWMLLGDLTSKVPGKVKGIFFLDEKSGWIASSYAGTDPVPLYRTIDGGKSWMLQKLPLPKGYRTGDPALPEVYEDKHGTLKVEYAGDKGPKAIRYETKDGGKTWHIFSLASLTNMSGDKAVLKLLRSFAEGWQSKDVKAVEALMEGGLPDFMAETIKSKNITFYTAEGRVPEKAQGEVCVFLRYQVDQWGDSRDGVMDVCMRKRADSKEWKVYMLD